MIPLGGVQRERRGSVLYNQGYLSKGHAEVLVGMGLCNSWERTSQKKLQNGHLNTQTASVDTEGVYPLWKPQFLKWLAYDWTALLFGVHLTPFEASGDRSGSVAAVSWWALLTVSQHGSGVETELGFEERGQAHGVASFCNNLLSYPPELCALSGSQGSILWSSDLPLGSTNT